MPARMAEQAYEPALVPEVGQERIDHHEVTRVIHEIEPALDFTQDLELRHASDLGLTL